MGLKYLAVVGINWPDGKGGMKRAEPGEKVPAAVVKGNQWLLEQGLVEAAAGEEEVIDDGTDIK